MRDEFLWVEKYRPQKVSETILPDSLKKTFQAVVNGKELPNMLLSGTAGTGKTTIINALSYALYGQALTKIRVDNLINKTNGKNMLVCLT